MRRWWKRHVKGDDPTEEKEQRAAAAGVHIKIEE